VRLEKVMLRVKRAYGMHLGQDGIVRVTWKWVHAEGALEDRQPEAPNVTGRSMVQSWIFHVFRLARGREETGEVVSTGRHSQFSYCKITLTTDVPLPNGRLRQGFVADRLVSADPEIT
jgi:hypothetical protein